MALGDARCDVVGLGARQAALQFQEVLQGPHLTRAGLDHVSWMRELPR